MICLEAYWSAVLRIAAAAVGASLYLHHCRPALGAEPSAAAAVADESPPTRTALFDPSLLLVRDDAVRQELGFTDAQQSAVDELLLAHNSALLAIRDVGPSGAGEALKPAISRIRGELRKLLTAEQRARLFGLILQSQGYDCLLREDMSKHLELSEEARQRLAAISEDVHARAAKLQATADRPAPEVLRSSLENLQAERRDRILAVLDDKQEARWGALLGEPFDFARAKPSPGLAPEFESIESWINADPLTMKSLRGQVVVVHFFAFGCINCINNYPWYVEWDRDFSGKGVKIVGIHTPETKAEEDVDNLRMSVEKHGLKFPVAVDQRKSMWQAWSNGVWPSVYLVDKQGRLRYWWYGELDWKGAGGQKVARQRILELLAE
jgi:peroxiredoxin